MAYFNKIQTNKAKNEKWPSISKNTGKMPNWERWQRETINRLKKEKQDKRR